MDSPEIRKYFNTPLIVITALGAVLILLLAPEDMRTYAIPAGSLLFGLSAAGFIFRYIPIGDDMTVYLASLPILIITIFILGWLWYAESGGSSENNNLIKERGLLLARGMIKDAMYMIHLHAAGNQRRSGGGYSVAYEDSATGYSIINSRFETPYNNAGVDIYLEYTGKDSIILIGESKTTDGVDPAYNNKNSRTGKIAFRSVQSSTGISFERLN